jgi:hypothetical protein
MRDSCPNLSQHEMGQIGWSAAGGYRDPQVISGGIGMGNHQVHVTPLTLNVAGEAALDAQVPWNPKDWLPPGGMVAL